MTPENEIARIAPATSISRTTGMRLAGSAASACARAISGRTATASSSPCSANVQKANRHSPAVANAPPMSGPQSADAVHTTDRQATIRGTSRLGKKRSWAMYTSETRAPPPSPCTVRPTSRTGIDGAAAQMTQPRV